MIFPLNTPFAVSYTFWYHISSFLFVLRNLLISSLTTHYSVMSYLVPGVCVVSSFISVININFIVLQSKNLVDMISILLNMWSYILCPSMWHFLENVPYALERNVYLSLGG